MDKKLAKVLKDANIKLKRDKVFQNFKISVSESNQVELVYMKNLFPIAYAESPAEAIAVINGYMTGLSHGKDNSYPRFRDKQVNN